jgi:hypothetical protein
VVFKRREAPVEGVFIGCRAPSSSIDTHKFIATASMPFPPETRGLACALYDSKTAILGSTGHTETHLKVIPIGVLRKRSVRDDIFSRNTARLHVVKGGPHCIHVDPRRGSQCRIVELPWRKSCPGVATDWCRASKGWTFSVMTVAS